ncbi:SPOSA6832_03897 [Sporobolomyces salmonicolor]|uniref:SPOSA6832_03897-mRNA-1:cds n=1 Tax=Sporidiobolus salmonicolor TaxID=5005 RepID=A0A0D6EQM1_SPOSA|nr:SPOSA6832_03897 [Sporobolomyces salmonicolor]
MSAYGKIAAPIRTAGEPLVPRTYPLPRRGAAVTVFPCNRETVSNELIEYLASVFNDVVEEGRTYPQREKLSFDDFAPTASSDYSTSLRQSWETLRAGSIAKQVTRSRACEQGGTGGSVCWGCTPNYPGRSSHNCNGGFVVPNHHRGLRIGSTLGRSYLHFAPLLGYRGSVFNLVYVSNEASVRIWDGLGFKRAGLIPKAGCLKSRTEGGEDEYVDAIVFHYDFTEGKQ